MDPSQILLVTIGVKNSTSNKEFSGSFLKKYDIWYDKHALKL
jgi:hypothetical protein